MGIGTATRTGVTSAITMLGSTITITPFTLAVSTDSNYTGQVETASTPVSTVGIPFEEFKSIVKQKFGDLEVAGTQLALKYTETFDITGSTKYKITWNSEVYDITRIQRFTIQDVLVAYIITLSKRLD